MKARKQALHDPAKCPSPICISKGCPLCKHPYCATVLREEQTMVKRAFQIITVFVLFSSAQRIHAHASVVRSEPRSGASVQSTNRIDLWFNELLENKFNFVQVIAADQLKLPAPQQNNLALETQMDPKDATHLSTKVLQLQPGSYVVRYRVLSRDGHSAPGQIEFRVTGKQ
jgi:copper resistance protein C